MFLFSNHILHLWTLRFVFKNADTFSRAFGCTIILRFPWGVSFAVGVAFGRRRRGWVRFSFRNTPVYLSFRGTRVTFPGTTPCLDVFGFGRAGNATSFSVVTAVGLGSSGFGGIAFFITASTTFTTTTTITAAAITLVRFGVAVAAAAAVDAASVLGHFQGRAEHGAVAGGAQRHLHRLALQVQGGAAGAVQSRQRPVQVGAAGEAERAPGAGDRGGGDGWGHGATPCGAAGASSGRVQARGVAVAVAVTLAVAVVVAGWLFLPTPILADRGLFLFRSLLCASLVRHVLVLIFSGAGSGCWEVHTVRGPWDEMITV